MQHSKGLHTLFMECVHPLGNICIVKRWEESAKACTLRASDVCKWHSPSAQAYKHQLWRGHIGNTTSTSTNDQQHQPILECFRKATSTNVKWYRPGDTGCGLPRQLQLVYTLNKCHAWTVRIGYGLCIKFGDCQSLTYLIAFGLHITTSRRQT